METTFYEDSRFRAKEEIKTMKRPMTLDLDSGKSPKKNRVTSVLTSPDLNMLKIGSPELERLVIAQQWPPAVSNACMYPKTDDRDQYGREFPDVIPVLQNPTVSMYQPPDANLANASTILPSSTMPCSTTMVDSYGYPTQQPLVTASCNSMVSSSTLNSSCFPHLGNNGYYHLPAEAALSIKEEPQTVPCMGSSPPQSPINMEDQEKLKLERKRLRNRIAASKCRRRKLEKIAKLEDKVASLKLENSNLQSYVNQLKVQVASLRQQVVSHAQAGCEIMITSFSDDCQDF